MLCILCVLCLSLQLHEFVQQLLEIEKAQRQRFSGLLARNTAAAATKASSISSSNTTATDADGTMHIGKMITRYIRKLLAHLLNSTSTFDLY
jgi:hypothetical protein